MALWKIPLIMLLVGIPIPLFLMCYQVLRSGYEVRKRMAENQHRALSDVFKRMENGEYSLPMRTFTVTEKQQAEIKVWSETQPKQSYRASGDCGESPLEYVFKDTGVGYIFFVRNTLNGEELDLTDYDFW